MFSSKIPAKKTSYLVGMFHCQIYISFTTETVRSKIFSHCILHNAGYSPAYLLLWQYKGLLLPPFPAFFKIQILSYYMRKNPLSSTSRKKALFCLTDLFPGHKKGSAAVLFPSPHRKAATYGRRKEHPKMPDPALIPPSPDLPPSHRDGP